MKKQLLLSLLVTLCIGSSFAQITIEEKQKYDRKITENFTPNNNNKAGGGWFNYGKELDGISSDLNSYGGILHPDSSIVDGYIDDNNDTVSYTLWHHSRGQMLDPVSFNFTNTGEAEFFFSGEGFILDTIYFPYQYIRPQTTNPDKLIVQFYTTDNGGIAANNPQSWGDLYPISYDYITQRGMNAKQTIEYDLTDNDVTPVDSGWYLDFALDPVITMPNGGFVAATYTFVPGNTFNPGDTIASHDQPWNVTNPRNAFLGYYWRDLEAIDDGTQNYNLAVPSDVQYNVSTNGWNGSYCPGDIWSVGGDDIMLHQNIWFHLTPMVTQPTNTSNINGTNIKLYPNPANNKVSIVFDNSNDINSIRITDITGRTVYTEIIANNTNAITINTSHYTPGIYFCEINGGTTVETIKFTKIK